MWKLEREELSQVLGRLFGFFISGTRSVFTSESALSFVCSKFEVYGFRFQVSGLRLNALFKINSIKTLYSNIVMSTASQKYTATQRFTARNCNKLRLPS